MVSQGFFSPEKRRMAGEKENKPFFSVKVEPVQIANNINSYQDQTPSVRYPGDDYKDAYRKESEERPTYKSTYEKQQEQAKQIEKDFNLDPRGITYTPRDESKYEGSVIKSSLGLPDKTLTTKEKILGTKPIGYREGDGLTVNPIKFDKGTAYGIGLNLDFKNKYGLTKDPIFGGSMYSNDPVTQSYVKAIGQSASDSFATEERLRKEQLAAKEQAKIDAANAKFEKISQDFLNDPAYKDRLKKVSESESSAKEETSTVDKVFGFLDSIGKIERVGPQVDQTSYTSDTPKLGTMPSMGISEAGREEAKQNRLEKAKEEANLQDTRNVFQKIGDTVGDVFNKITGTEAAGADTLQAQGINTSATTNIAQIGNVSPTVQRARQAVEKSVRQQTGMPSNPGSQRQTGVGVSANNLSRHKTGHSASRGGISKSTSRGQGGGPSSRSRGGVSRGGSRSNTGSKSSARGARGSTGSRGRGGTGTGSSRSGGTTGRSASSASKGRTGRSRSQCDIRTKIDISPLINSNLVKDNLALIAYFVQEIKN
jgi:hypothetical protein